MIIIEIREFKERIKISYKKLQDMKDALETLRAELIAQDAGNALSLMRTGLIKLRERNQISKDKLT